MDRNADCAGLIRNGTGDGLPNPPGCIGTELETFVVIEFFNGLDKAQVAFLNQVQEEHATAHIPFRNTDDQAQVGFGQTLFGVLPEQFVTAQRFPEVLRQVGQFLFPGLGRRLPHLFLQQVHQDMDFIEALRGRFIGVFAVAHSAEPVFTGDFFRLHQVVEAFPFILGEVPRLFRENLRRDLLAVIMHLFQCCDGQRNGAFVRQPFFFRQQGLNPFDDLLPGRFGRQFRHIGADLLVGFDAQGLFALIHALGEFDFVLALQQAHTADFLQIHTDRVVNGHGLRAGTVGQRRCCRQFRILVAVVIGRQDIVILLAFVRNDGVVA